MQDSSSSGSTISVVCPTYNSALFIDRTLNSVFTQVLPPYELIVADDGSTDDTVRILRDLLAAQSRILTKLVMGRHGGASAARNLGIRHASADWVSFIDADDEWLQHKLETVSAVISTLPEVNFICHSEEDVDLQGERALLDYGAFFDATRPLGSQLYLRNLFSTSAVTCRRSLLMKQGMFDEQLRTAEDYDLWLRLASEMKPYFIREVLGRYVHRRGNLMSGAVSERWKDFMRVLVRHRRNVSVSRCVYRATRASAVMAVSAFQQALRTRHSAGPVTKEPQ